MNELQINVLHLFQNQVENTLAEQASSFLGEEKTKVASAMTAILPSLIGSMIDKSSNSDGASEFLQTITSKGHDGSMLNNVSELFDSNDNTNHLMSYGAVILSHLLGDKLEKIVGSISNFSGMDKESAVSLMEIAAPLTMSLVGKQAAHKGLNASGLANLLSSQKKHVNAAILNFPEIGSLFNFTEGFKDSITESNIGTTENSRTEINIETMNTNVKAIGTTNEKAGNSILKWLIPLILLLLAAGYFGLMTGCGTADNNTDNTGKETILENNNVDETKETTDETASLADEGLKSVTLPGGKEIAFAEGAFEDQIVGFMNADEQDFSTGFAFDGLNFRDADAELADDSERQINNLAAILSLYQDYNIKIVAYNKSDKALAANRAKSIKTALVGKGITTDRITTTSSTKEENNIQLFFSE